MILFGFDTAVISGADQPLQRLWETSDLFHGAMIMSALWGTVIGALSVDYFVSIMKKESLISVGVLYFISALGSALSNDPVSVTMRLLGGLSRLIINRSSAYISEIAPAQHRGRLVALYQFQIVLES